MIGTRLGSYEITAKLGEGGMGEVYRATDSKLKRQVAIKVLPAAFTEDKERLARFEREAQLLAQLHHPHIASIFGLEESEGVRALVMELVEGDDLSALIANGPLPVAEALVLARQIAGALEAAHEQGIIHRDLKPQNIKIARDGAVKVLDFGLAKAMEPPGSGSAADLARSPTLMNSPTLTGMHGTQLGVILGSAAYMAPEQAKGMAVDKRADIWAFGVVLYEMLTGGSLFAGDSVGDTLAAVIRAEIDLGKLPENTPSAIRQLLRRCLERNPKNRLHDIADARIMLDEVLSAPSEPAAAAAAHTPGGRPWPAYLLGALGLGLGLTAIALPWLRDSNGAAAPASLRLEIAAPEDTTLLSGVAISPDGKTLALVARGKEGRSELWVRRLDSLQARALPGTADARYPFWSPDGKRIGFFAEARLKVTDLVGMPRILATTAATTDARGGSWGEDDTILYAPSFVGGLKRISARGGEPVSALEIPEGSDLGTLRFPHFLPDGRRFVVYGSPGSGSEPGQLLLGELGSASAKVLTDSSSMAVFAAPDRLLYVRGEALVAQRFDLAAGALAGEAEPLDLSLPGGFAVSSQRSLSVSRNGILVARRDKRGVTHPQWVDRQGKELEEISGGGQVWWYAPRMSPDGRRLAISRYESGGSGDVWIHDFERGVASRVTFGDGDDQIAVWSSDGRTLAFSSTRAGRPVAILLAATDRPGQERLWFESSGFLIPSAFTPDGRELVFERGDDNGLPALWIGSIEGPAAPRRLFSDPGGEWAADLSPDGRYIAYASDITRRSEVYVRKLDGSDNPLRISTEGGGQPRWRRDGRELYYVDESGRLVALDVEPGEPPRFSAPTVLFDARHEDAVDRQYDVALDGQRFFLNRRAGGDREPILVLIGWDRTGSEAQP